MSESNTVPSTEYQMKKLLNTLSKEIYGTSSKWQKLMNKGVAERREPTPDNHATHTTVRQTLADIYEHMVSVKQQREALVHAFHEQQASEKAKRDLEASLSGSATS